MCMFISVNSLSDANLKPRSLAFLLRRQYELPSGIWINKLQGSMFLINKRYIPHGRHGRSAIFLPVVRVMQIHPDLG